VIATKCASARSGVAVMQDKQEILTMRELTEVEVGEVSGGIIPIVFGLIGLNLALDAVFLGYAAYAANNFHQNRRQQLQ
jgi:hypothetical protein